MSAEKLNVRTSFSWLADEIRNWRARQAEYEAHREEVIPKVDPAQIERAMLKGYELRALKFGEILGGAAKAASQLVHGKAA